MKIENCTAVPLPMPNETREQRAQRIDTLKRLILDDEYPVDPESLADAILDGNRRRWLRTCMREEGARKKKS